MQLGLEALQKPKQQRRAALQRLNQIRQNVYQGTQQTADDLLEQARQEREEDAEAMLRELV